MTLTIKTNHQARELMSLADADCDPTDFSYIEGDDRYSPRLFKYRGAWYDAGEFLWIDPDRQPCDSALAEWQGFQSNSYFSGVLIRYTEDFEAVVVARYSE